MGPRKESIKPFTPKNNTKENQLLQIVTDDKNQKDNSTKPKITTIKKKHLENIVKTELSYISTLFDVLDIASLTHGRRNASDEEDSDEMEVQNIPEKKVFKKQKKSAATVKTKSFPQSIDGLEKELQELKGTPMTYQKKLRQKGLQSRLIKKKRKEEKKLRKAAKQGKKHNPDGGPVKTLKPIFNSDGNVVTNKFDFADNEVKKDNKRKLGYASSEISVNHEGTKKKCLNQASTGSISNELLGQDNKTNISLSENFKNNHLRDASTSDVKFSTQKANNDLNRPKIKKEDANVENDRKMEENKIVAHQGPVFNKDNKMVFSKVFIPENNKKSKKKITDPKKILKKLKEDSKKISELEKEDKEKAVSLKEKQKWAAALKRASGEKVRDDPELLRKTISKEKNKKMRSQKKWQARIERVQKEKDDRQKKRTENIQSRKNDKKKQKMKKAIKRGSYVQL